MGFLKLYQVGSLSFHAKKSIETPLAIKLVGILGSGGHIFHRKLQTADNDEWDYRTYTSATQRKLSRITNAGNIKNIKCLKQKNFKEKRNPKLPFRGWGCHYSRQSRLYLIFLEQTKKHCADCSEIWRGCLFI